MPRKDRFSDNDVRRIVAEGARVQDETAGISYNELREIAASVGVSEESIQRVLTDAKPQRSLLRRVTRLAQWSFYGAIWPMAALTLPVPWFSSVPGADGVILFAALAALIGKRGDFKAFHARNAGLWSGFLAMVVYLNRGVVGDPGIAIRILTMVGTVFAISCLVGTAILLVRGSGDGGAATADVESMRARIGRKLKSWIDIVFHRASISLDGS